MDPYPTDQQEAGEPPLPDRARAAVDPLLRAAVRTLPEATGAFCAELLGRARPGRSVGPALVLAAARAVGGLEEDALTAAASIELVYVMGLLYEDTAGLDPSARPSARPSAPPAAGRAGEALAALAIRLVAGRSAAVGVLCDCLVERSEAGDEAAGRQGVQLHGPGDVRTAGLVADR
ncbi:hypothetical protein AB0D15_41395, partial [Streptomyces sp. NPDC048551]